MKMNINKDEIESPSKLNKTADDLAFLRLLSAVLHDLAYVDFDRDAKNIPEISLSDDKETIRKADEIYQNMILPQIKTLELPKSIKGPLKQVKRNDKKRRV